MRAVVVGQYDEAPTVAARMMAPSWIPPPAPLVVHVGAGGVHSLERHLGELSAGGPVAGVEPGALPGEVLVGLAEWTAVRMPSASRSERSVGPSALSSHGGPVGERGGRPGSALGAGP
jgi:hypothetical protein